MNLVRQRSRSVEPRDRGQVGIGTLVVFIAMVLVAAVAAGVLINTAASLQATAEDVGRQSVDRVVDGVDVVGATGHVTGTVDDGVPNRTVDTVRLWIRPRAAAGDVNVSDLTVKWVGPHAAETLTFGGSGAAAPSTGDVHEAFNATQSIGDGDLLLETGEEFVLYLNASQIESGGSGTPETLERGEEATVEMTVSGGSTSVAYLRVPEYAGNETYVPL
ncbi:archaellin/type IV pilin N-terminal domain-containing protein [Halogeometricum luteum]|uniref:Flagellin n=1 Tax=Halogeometricum luteum TaxID=2950537 RepID=A0ABU2G0U6_9EURY|nr:archaellin/type IV pilin N-terminal domain-containing protein [Halogeometricum sp. S3BR5-2]MDS0293908.1 flagellin-like protein [Halogeometricum sp. S3BR5-2]